MTIVIPGTIGRCSLEREHPFLTELDLIMNSCFVQYNASLLDYVKVAQKKVSQYQERLVFVQFQIKFIIFEVYTVSVTVQDNIEFVFISLEVYTFFSPTIKNCPFPAKYFFLEYSLFNVWQLLHFNYS